MRKTAGAIGTRRSGRGDRDAAIGLVIGGVALGGVALGPGFFPVGDRPFGERLRLCNVGEMPSIEIVFAAVDVMTPEDRLNLCRIVRSPTGPFPFLPAEIARLPLPQDTGVQTMMLDIIRRAVRTSVDSEMSGRLLREIVPGITAVPGGVSTAIGTRNRLVALVQPAKADSWIDLADFRISDIRNWRGAGASVITSLICLAIRSALAHYAPATFGSTHANLFDLPRSDLAQAADRVLAAVTDPRSRAIFEYQDLRVDLVSGHLSSSEVADMVGAGVVNGRKLRSKARNAVVEAAAGEPLLQTAAANVQETLGTAVTLEQAASVLSHAFGRDHVNVVGEAGGIGDPAGQLLVWLAGPYRPIPGFPGWLSTNHARLVEETTALLRDSGGVHDHLSLIGDLTARGLTDVSAEAWLAAQPAQFIHGAVVYLLGSVAVVAERLLEAAGQALSTAELTQAIPSATLPVVVGELRRSSRFVETAPGCWELADWGGTLHDYRVRFTIEMSAAVIAGSSQAVDPTIAELLGLSCGVPRRFPTRFGPLTIGCDNGQVTCGSVRPLALACGAALGDRLEFAIYPRSGAVEVDIVRDPSSSLFPDPV